MKKKPKPGRAGRGNARPITKTEPVDSFFSFFSPPKVPEDEDDNELEEEDIEALQSALEEDYELGWATLRLRHCIPGLSGVQVPAFSGNQSESLKQCQIDTCLEKAALMCIPQFKGCADLSSSGEALPI